MNANRNDKYSTITRLVWWIERYLVLCVISGPVVMLSLWQIYSLLLFIRPCLVMKLHSPLGVKKINRCLQNIMHKDSVSAVQCREIFLLETSLVTRDYGIRLYFFSKYFAEVQAIFLSKDAVLKLINISVFYDFSKYQFEEKNPQNSLFRHLCPNTDAGTKA